MVNMLPQPPSKNTASKQVYDHRHSHGLGTLRCDKGNILGMNGFGASAPYQTLTKEFGITVENVLAKAKELRG